MAFVIEGPMTLKTAGALKPRLLEQIRAGVTRIELSSVTDVDSVAIALLLAAKREASRLQQPLEILAMPSSLTELIRVYGLSELF